MAETSSPGATSRLPSGKRSRWISLWLALLSALLGVVTGFGSYAFRVLIGVVHNLAFLGQFSAAYDSNIHTPPGPWGMAVVLAPVVGAVLVVFLTKHFAPEARGHGVPEVMDAIYYHRGVIRPVVAAVKSVASALSIGTGGAVGREGPIIQIGAAVASWMGQRVRVSRWELATLVAAGGGAGIAATFNTPIGGVLFAVEVLMHEVSVRTLVPVAIATATATYVGMFLFGNHPAFLVPELHMPTGTGAVLLPAYLGLGVLMALVSVVFIRCLYGAEDLFERWIPRREYLRHTLGMLVVGLVFVALMKTTGHYYVEGVGYAAIMDVLTGTLHSIPLLLLLFLLKLLCTSLTLGSGASGGIFSPSLFMGATLGGAYGLGLQSLFPGLNIDPSALALAGMAGLVAGGTGAALTAIVMIFEMTLDYSVVLPMTLTVAVSYGLRRVLFAESIYTMKLTRRGHHMPEALQANAHMVQHVSEVVTEKAGVAGASTRVSDIRSAAEPGGPAWVVVLDDDGVVGVLPPGWSKAMTDTTKMEATAGEAAQKDVIAVPGSTTIFELLAKMQSAHASVAAVVDDEKKEPTVLGIMTMAKVAEVLAAGMELFRD